MKKVIIFNLKILISLFLIQSTMFISCDNENQIKQKYGGDPDNTSVMISEELEVYVDDWISECEKRNIDYSSIGSLYSIYTNNDLDESTYAVTYFDTHTIEIKTDGQTDWQKRFLIYHELGHYVFGLEHSKYDDVIMTWDMKYEDWYGMSWEEMKEEYFGTVSDNYYKN